jgi:hypothetical protein
MPPHPLGKIPMAKSSRFVETYQEALHGDKESLMPRRERCKACIWTLKTLPVETHPNENLGQAAGASPELMK